MEGRDLTKNCMTKDEPRLIRQTFCELLVCVIRFDVFFGQRADPGSNLGRESRNNVWISRDKVLAFPRVIFNIVKLQVAAVLADGIDQLPLAISDTCVAVGGTGFPVKRLGSHMLAFTEPRARTILSIEVSGLDFYTRDRAQGWQIISTTDDGLLIDSICRNMTRPTNDPRHAHTSFEHAVLTAAVVAVIAHRIEPKIL